MTAIITKDFRIHTAASFKSSFSSVTDNLYLFIGRSKNWTDEDSPDAPSDSVLADYQAWDEMLAMKKISESTVSHVVPLLQWVTNTKYVPYSQSDTELFDHPTSSELSAAASGGYIAGGFYTVTSSYNVYKCLDNNRGAVSTTEPSGTGTSPIRTADGYLWKYLYTLSAGDSIKYLTPNWIPVKTLDSDDGSTQWTVQEAAVSGSIEAVRVSSTGSGYSNTHSGTVVAASNSGTTLVTLASGASSVDDIYNDSTIHILTGPGAGLSGKITDYVGSTKVATLDVTLGTLPTTSSTYQVLPTVKFTGNGTGAKAKPVITSGAISRVDVTAVGSGYSTVTAVIEGGGGSGATLVPEIGPIGGHGSDPVSELGGRWIMVNVKLQYNEGGDFPTTNDYRRIGIIKNVKNANGTLASASTLNCLRSFTLSGVVGTFQTDEIFSVQGSPTIKGRIVQIDGGNVIRFFQDSETGYETLTASQIIQGASSAATGTIAGSITEAETEKFSGKVLYIEQRRKITRSQSQQEDIKLVIQM